MADEPTTRRAIESFTVELAHLADGGFHVSIMATTVDEEEPQLLHQEIGSERVASLDDALAVIRAGVLQTSNNSR